MRDFVERKDTGDVTVVWREPDVSSWSDGVAEGERRADQIVDYLKETDDRPLFIRVILEASQSGRTSTVVGFLDRIAHHVQKSAKAILSITVTFATVELA